MTRKLGLTKVLAVVVLAAAAWVHADDPMFDVDAFIGLDASVPEVDAFIEPEASIPDVDGFIEPEASMQEPESAVTPVPPAFNGHDTEVTVPPGLTVFAAVEHLFAAIPLHLNYLEMMKTNEVAVIQEAPSTFYTEVPMHWRLVLREIVEPQGMDFIEDGDIVRLGPIQAVEDRYQAIEQDRLRRNRTRIEVNFAEGVLLFPALGLIRNLAKVNMNFDYMAPADRGIAPPSAPGGDKDGSQAPQGPPPKMTTYATPENQPVEWRVVMREVLGPHGYDFVEARGVVRPMLQAQADEWRKQQIDAKPLISKIVRIHHMDPAQLIERIKAMGLSRHSGASITLAHGLDSKSKGVGIARHSSPPAVIVRDMEENMDRILAEIKKLDTRERQVMIEARILDIGKNASRDLGMMFNRFGGSMGFNSSYEKGYSRDRVRTYNESSGSDYEVDRFVTQDRVRPANNDAGNTLNMSMNERFTNAREAGLESSWGMAYDLMLNPLQLSAAWSMLQSSDDVKIVSQPVLVLSDHAESFIRVETEVPYVNLRNEYQQQSGATIQSYTWETINIGVDLRVVPEITADGKSVRLSVLPRITANAGMVTAPDGSQRPTLEVRELDTRVTVESGYTLMMGGLISTSSHKAETKIPFLGDIPLLGWLFRRKGTGGEERNLVMLITPTILGEEAPDTGYERASEPHFLKLKQDMTKTMLDGVDEALIRQIDRKLSRELEAQEQATPVTDGGIPEPRAGANPADVPSVPVATDAALEQRMREIEASVLQDLE